MYFEALIKCSYDDELSYDHYYIVEADDQNESMEKVSKFISTYFVNEEIGTLLVDHDNIAYKFSDGEIVELIRVTRTTAEQFLEDRIGKLFLIAEEHQDDR